MFNKRKIFRLKIKIAGLKAQLEEERRMTATSHMGLSFITGDIVREIAELEADLAERIARG